MPIRTEKVGAIPRRCRIKPKLLKHDGPRLIRNDANNAVHMLNNANINRASQLVFNMLDRINPFLMNHTKFSKVAMYICEKSIRFFSANNIKTFLP